MAEEKKVTKKASTSTAKKAPAKKTAAKKTTEVKAEEVKVETAVVEEAPKAAKKAPAKKPAAKKAAAPKAEKVEEKKPAKVMPTEAMAFARDVRITPRKVRLVADLVRGKKVADALGLLSRLNRAASAPVAKIIKSAAANAANNFGMDKDNLYVAEIQVSDGMKIKRFIPRAKGSASGIIKRNANIRCVVKESK